MTRRQWSAEAIGDFDVNGAEDGLLSSRRSVISFYQLVYSTHTMVSLRGLRDFDFGAFFIVSAHPQLLWVKGA